MLFLLTSSPAPSLKPSDVDYLPLMENTKDDAAHELPERTVYGESFFIETMEELQPAANMLKSWLESTGNFTVPIVAQATLFLPYHLSYFHTF